MNAVCRKRSTRSSPRVAKLEKEVRDRREVHDREREVLHGIEVEQTRAEADWERLREHAAGRTRSRGRIAAGGRTRYRTMNRRHCAPISRGCAPRSSGSVRSICSPSRSSTSSRRGRTSSRTSARISWRPCTSLDETIREIDANLHRAFRGHLPAGQRGLCRDLQHPLRRRHRPSRSGRRGRPAGVGNRHHRPTPRQEEPVGPAAVGWRKGPDRAVAPDRALPDQALAVLHPRRGRRAARRRQRRATRQIWSRP